MAKTTTKSTAKPKPAKSGSAKSGTKADKAKAAPKAKPPAKVKRASSSGGNERNQNGGMGESAVDMLIKLLESPIVADLLAVGATAALSAVAESRFSRRDGDARKSTKTLKAAGSAAAAAIGRRLNEEIEAIRESAKKSSGGAEA